MAVAEIKTGLEVLASESFKRLRGRRVGLLGHQSSLTAQFHHAIDLLNGARDVDLVRLFGPEHGIRGEAQDMESVHELDDQQTKLPVVSLYGDRLESLRPEPEQLDGLDLVVVDLQDVGARYYTYAATMYYLMEVCAARGVGVLVLDRPNPLGGEKLEGPLVKEGFESFVGALPIPIRHGLTIGEIAEFARQECSLDLDLEVVKCQGLTRNVTAVDTKLIWVPPSPNMPTLETAWVYPGGCLLEGTNLSEGRGTTRPFLQFGAPWLTDWRPDFALGETEGQGFRIRPCSFRPMFQKHAGEICYGAAVHLIDPTAFSSVLAYVGLIVELARFAPEHFQWRKEAYEFVEDRLAIDLLFGSDRDRVLIEPVIRDPGVDLRDLLGTLQRLWEAELAEFQDRREPILLYR